ncbi:MAG: V-type ATP synthase subunit I [Parcubacteria bacterium OLB19]|nr:MAG: V-type ATP synthase subunit I [Parcubacteria bacterium OLB19]
MSKKIENQNLTLSEQINASFGKEAIESYVEDVGNQYFSVTVPVGTDNNLVLQIIKSLGGEVINLVGYTKRTVDEIEYLNKRIAEVESALAETKSKLILFATNYLEKIKIAHDALVWDCDRELVGGLVKNTKHITVFEGWADKSNLPLFEKKITEEGVLYDLAEISLAENEIPPVEIRNHKLIQPFEIITRLNGLPGHKDIDPTPFMAVFFFVFFGLCLTDVGYGALLMLMALPFLFYFKVSKIAKQFSQLIFLLGLSTVVIGMFFGGYFGVNMSEMPKFLQDLQAFDPIGNPLPVFYLALSLGVLQVMVGMILKIVSESKNGQLVNGLLDQGPWLLLFTLLIVYGATTFGFLPFNEERIVTLIYLAIAFVILASGRTGKTILGKVQMSLLSVYNSINYLSDILSYSRLLALGLATSALAFAVNLIAGIVYEMIPYIGAVLAVFVLIVGHVFTLVINTLGSFIHSARLQFVEFFGKFITGTGREFKPLTKRESYTCLLKEDSG